MPPYAGLLKIEQLEVTQWYTVCTRWYTEDSLVVEQARVFDLRLIRGVGN